MAKKKIFLFFCTVFVVVAGMGQVTNTVSAPDSSLSIFFPRSFSASKMFSPPIKVISQGFYTDNFGFFCDKEWKLEKAIKVPVKIRIGTVQQVDYLENKPNAIKPAY